MTHSSRAYSDRAGREWTVLFFIFCFSFFWFRVSIPFAIPLLFPLVYLFAPFLFSLRLPVVAVVSFLCLFVAYTHAGSKSDRAVIVCLFSLSPPCLLLLLAFYLFFFLLCLLALLLSLLFFFVYLFVRLPASLPACLPACLLLYLALHFCCLTLVSFRLPSRGPLGFPIPAFGHLFLFLFLFSAFALMSLCFFVPSLIPLSPVPLLGKTCTDWQRRIFLLLFLFSPE
jgi:hypothetical protein